MSLWTDLISYRKNNIESIASGRAIDTASLPSYTADDPVPVGVDKSNGALLASVVSGGSIPASTFGSIANVTVVAAGTAVRASAQACTRGATVYAATTNTGSVYIGGSGVTNASGAQRGIELTQAGTTGLLPINNTNLIYVNADNAGDKVGIVYI